MKNLFNIDDDFNGAVLSAKSVYTDGGVLVYPTDTIYGFGGDPFNHETVKRINSIKGRDESKRFILLADSIDTVASFADLKHSRHEEFLRKVWPNPISIILRLKNSTAELLDTPTAAFRIPAEPFCRSLLSLLKRPLISTSVNRSGEAAMNEIDLITSEFGQETDAIYYYPVTPKSTASTIIDLTDIKGPMLIREGSFSYNSILEKY